MFYPGDWVEFTNPYSNTTFGQLDRALLPGWWSVSEETDSGMEERPWALHENQLTLISGCCGRVTDEDHRFCPRCHEHV